MKGSGGASKVMRQFPCYYPRTVMQAHVADSHFCKARPTGGHGFARLWFGLEHGRKHFTHTIITHYHYMHITIIISVVVGIHIVVIIAVSS